MNLLVGISAERIDVESESSGKKNRILRNDGQPRSQTSETDLRDVAVVDDDRPLHRFDDPEEGQSQRWLSGSGSADDSDFFSSHDFSGNAFQNQVQAFAIPGLIVLELDLRLVKWNFNFS